MNLVCLLNQECWPEIYSTLLQAFDLNKKLNVNFALIDNSKQVLQETEYLS